MELNLKEVTKQMERASAELKKTTAKLKKQLEPVELKKATAKLRKQLEQVPEKVVEAIGIAPASRMKQLRGELAKLAKKVEELAKRAA